MTIGSIITQLMQDHCQWYTNTIRQQTLTVEFINMPLHYLQNMYVITNAKAREAPQAQHTRSPLAAAQHVGCRVQDLGIMTLKDQHYQGAYRLTHRWLQLATATDPARVRQARQARSSHSILTSHQFTHASVHALAAALRLRVHMAAVAQHESWRVHR